ncbi:Crp/Fnr family transcriptional regulator [Chitinophaga agrisoli]|uniref:Crp/Fnr family transcriptional regulator n=1 Tax=Chitinophaga agrisoli TaxID=2607653 RepID=A0A5B2VM40_9BACT|nr:Crp/Fnr family transcriptional regulator [Chitinophaga agrisoli]KAA2239720.1 Crp/Fnr family transcriptional regulator [Chitinophaga agrisoli]
MRTIPSAGLYEYLTEQKIPGYKDKVKHITLKKGHQLYGPPQRHTDIYEIITGAVKLGDISPKGEEYIYEILVPGEFFGNLALLGDDFSELCKALCATQLRTYDLAFFKHLTTHDPSVAEWFISKVVSRWNKTESVLACIRAFEPRERIQYMYNTMDKRIIIPGNREITLNKLLTNKDLADLTATTRQLVADTIK